MSDFSFFWHDYETFGRVPRRDRPAQFAGIRTDAELNEIGPAVMHHCKPAPDFLPDPESCLLTGILPQECLERGLDEHAFADAIEAELARPGTVGVGYNSIRFDDEVTRHLFWRNLIDPYAREWQNQCGRWDLLDVVRCTWALRPEGIEWPAHADGRPSFRLEDLTRANGLAHEAAHDALSDVRATIGLARTVRTAQPRLFDFCLKLRHKDAVREEIARATAAGEPLLHVSGMYPAERGCMALVWPLAPHPTNRNELIVWDLAQDPALLGSLDAAALRERLFTRREDLPEGVERLPVKTIHLNKSPVVIGNLRTLSPATAERFGLSVEAARAQVAAAAREAQAVAGLWREVYERPAPADVPRCRRGPVRRLPVAGRPACARPPARNAAGGPGDSAHRLRGRAAGRAAVPLPGAQLPRHAGRRGPRALAGPLRAAPACRCRRWPDAGGLLRAHRHAERDGRRARAGAAGRAVRLCGTDRAAAAMTTATARTSAPATAAPQRIAVFGAGAVGCCVGGLLAQAGHEVTLIGRPALAEAVAREGLWLDSPLHRGPVPVQAGTGPQAAAGAQLLLLGVKSFDTEAAAQALAPHLAPGALVLSLQNGVDNAARLRAALPGQPVAAVAVYLACAMTGPSRVEHRGGDTLRLGPGAAARGGLDAAQGAALLRSSGLQVDVLEAIDPVLWTKLAANCAYNALCALSGLPYGRLVEAPGVRETMHAAIDELVAVAAAEGVDLPPTVHDVVDSIARTMASQHSSTAQDLMRGRRSEIDHLNGHVVARGAAHGLATPVNRTLWAAVKALEVARTTGGPGAAAGAAPASPAG